MELERERRKKNERERERKRQRIGKKEEEACQDLNQIPQDQGRHYNSLATRAAQTCQSSIARWAQELFDYLRCCPITIR